MKDITIEELSGITGLSLRSLADLLKATIVIVGPELATYGVTVSAFRMKTSKNTLVLYAHTGEMLTLYTSDEGNYRWEFRIPMELHPVPIMNLGFYF